MTTTTPSPEEVIDDYLAKLKVDFRCSASPSPTSSMRPTPVGGWFLSTPFARPDGEGVEIELQALPDGRISMSDMGDTLGYLYVNGLTLSQTLIANVRQMAKLHGVELDRNCLNVQVAPNSAGTGLHRMIQTILAVAGLVNHTRMPRANGDGSKGSEGSETTLDHLNRNIK